MRKLRIERKRLEQIIKEENARIYHELRPLTIEQKNEVSLVVKKILSESDFSLTAAQAGEIAGSVAGSAIAKGGELTAEIIRDMNNSGMTRLLGNAFLTTLRVDVMRFIFGAFGMTGVAGEVLSQSLASIRFVDWPEIIDTWETDGCEIVTDAIARGLIIKASQAGSDVAFDYFARIPLIGPTLSELRNTEDGKENRLIRVARQAGVDTLSDIPEIEAVKAVVREQICGIDIRNINAGNIEQLKSSLLGALSAAGGVGVIDQLRNAGEEIGSNTPHENAEAMGHSGAPVEEVDDSMGEVDIQTQTPAPPLVQFPTEYDAIWAEEFNRIAVETLGEDAAIIGDISDLIQR